MLYGFLAAHEWLSLREVVRLVLLSTCLSAWCCIAFPENASSRRVLLLTTIVAMALLPWFLQTIDLQWQLPVAILPTLHLELGVPNLLVFFWLVVAALLIARHLHRMRVELKRVAALPGLCDPVLSREIGQLRKALLPNYPNLPMPEVRLGQQACATTLRGTLLVLPHNWRTFSVDTRRSVLAHELTHIARRDDRWLLLLRVLLLCYWWMPWLRKLQQVYIQSMEESCDDVASELIGVQHTYVHALFEVALNSAPMTKIQSQKLHLTHVRGHPLMARVARFGQRRPLELDTAGVFWTLILITLLVIWVSGVQPVLASRDVSPANPAQVYQLSVVPMTAPSLYPLVTEHAVAGQMNKAQAWRLQTPLALTAALDPGNALRAVRASRYQPIYKVMDIQSNPVAMRRAIDARRLTVSPHVEPVRYEQKFSFRIDRR